MEDSTFDATILLSLFLNRDRSDLPEDSSLYEYSFSLFVFLRALGLGENRLPPEPREGAAVEAGSLKTE